MSKPSITICIPAYNAEKTIAASIESALDQTIKKCEVLVYDDGSADRTAEIVKRYPKVRLVRGEINLGIGQALRRLMAEARSHNVIYLCADDLFTDKDVVRDYVEQFKNNPRLAVIGRYYFEFMEGVGPVGTFREKNIFLSSCNPSGMALRKMEETWHMFSNRKFIEMPHAVRHLILEDYDWTMLEYDTVAVRIHRGGNTGTKEEYYGMESPTRNWTWLIGEPFYYPPIFVQLKNNAPKLLWREICQVIRQDKRVFLKWDFWWFALIAVVVPRSVLKRLSDFYRREIGRRTAEPIRRPNREQDIDIGRRGVHRTPRFRTFP